MAKKRFKDTGVGKFLLEKIPNVVGAIAGDTPVGSVIQAIIGGSDMSEADKKIALKKLDLERAEIDGTTRRWVADATSGSWLPFRFNNWTFNYRDWRIFWIAWC